MAFLNIYGLESGDLSEFVSVGGGTSVVTTPVRTGVYALKLDNALGSSVPSVEMSGIGATGRPALNTPNIYFAGYFRIGTAPPSNLQLVMFLDAGTSHYQVTVELKSDSTLVLNYYNGSDVKTAVGSPSSALSADTLYLIEVKATGLATPAGATVELKLDGVVQATGTGLTVDSAPANCAAAYVGTFTNVVHVVYWDDFAISDSGYIGAGRVNILKPDGLGNYTAWTNGAGTAPTNVAEVPPDGDTTYITSVLADAETETMSAATGVVDTGVIGAVKAVAIMRDLTSTASVKVRVRSGSTDSDNTAATLTTGYLAYCRLLDADPADAGAWTLGDLDAVEIGVSSAAAVAARCTALYAMVWSAPALPGQPIIKRYGAVPFAGAKTPIQGQTRW